MRQLPLWPGADPELWYFGYGSNMSRDVFCGWRGMQPTDVCWGWLEGWRLVFDLPIGSGERGVANVRPEEGARTCGVLWRITASELHHLDATEGVAWGAYRRAHVLVRAAGDLVRAVTYHSDRAAAGRRPSRRYRGLLLYGARQHGLPAEYVRWLESLELARDEREPPPASARRRS